MNDTANDTITVTVEDKKAMLDMVTEITHSLGRIDKEREQMKDISQSAQDKFGIKKKYFNQMAKVMYAKSFADLQSETSHFESLYELIVGERDEFEGK